MAIEKMKYMKVGEPVVGSGSPLSVLLGPGVMGNIFDGIERPLQVIAANVGPFIPAGATADSLDFDKKWDVTMLVKAGDTVKGGTIFATCPETSIITHKSMLENINIPKFEENIRFISGVLEEREREEFTRLKVIKKTKKS